MRNRFQLLSTVHSEQNDKVYVFETDDRFEVWVHPEVGNVIESKSDFEEDAICLLNKSKFDITEHYRKQFNGEIPFADLLNSYYIYENAGHLLGALKHVHYTICEVEIAPTVRGKLSDALSSQKGVRRHWARNGISEFYISDNVATCLRDYLRVHGVELETGATYEISTDSRLYSQPCLADAAPNKPYSSVLRCKGCAAEFIALFENLDYHPVYSVQVVSDKPEEALPFQIELDYTNGTLYTRDGFLMLGDGEITNLMSAMSELKGSSVTEYFRIAVANSNSKFDLVKAGFVEVCKDYQGNPVYGAWDVDCPNCFLLFTYKLDWIFVDPNKF